MRFNVPKFMPTHKSFADSSIGFRPVRTVRFLEHHRTSTQGHVVKLGILLVVGYQGTS